ncbi:MAG: phospholipid/cholesterol/gamma-HCH transport system substrate-binding protein [Actinomycetota bacterium]|jgi:phospholipid/cholesterol/gamma-HCH transport system substrate-binding protein|nr:phospholipid/cholesterol/gamma-HCH transport system substrate-binding protein [Actinomycetota bacterium]
MKGTVVKFLAFIAVCSVFTGYLVFTIGNIHPFQSAYSLTAKFDDVTGLLPDDNVKIAGVVVGKVKSVSIDDGAARVRFTVRKGVKVPTDSAAAIRWRNLLGQRYVYLYPGTASTVLPAGGRVTHTRSVVDLGQLFNRLGPIVKSIDPDQVNAFLDSVSSALQGSEPQLRQALDDLATLASTLATRDEAIGRLVGNLDTVASTITDRDHEIRQLLDNLLAVASTFSANTDVLDEAVTQLGDFSSHLGKLLQDNRGHIDNIVNSLQVLIEVVNQKLPTLDTVVANLDDAGTRLFGASKYGEFLNQTIPCGQFFYPDPLPAAGTSCTAPGPNGVKPGSLGGGDVPTSSNTQALLELVQGGP